MTGKTERYRHFEYEITDDPEFINELFRIPEEVQLQFPSLHAEALEGGEKVIGRLKKLIERYPGIPQLKNYLSVAYHSSGLSDEAYKINRQIVMEHPDYLFGKLNLAYEYYDGEQYDRIPEVLGKVMELKDLYPERDRFHLGEVTGFLKAAILYFCATGELEKADRRYEIMEEISPDHPDTEQVFPHIVKARLEIAEKQWKEQERTRINVVSEGPGKKHQTATPPEFIHKEILWLYENDMRIDPRKLNKILSLDSDELIRDLRAVLKDSIYRFEFFSNLTEKEGWQEEKVDFVLHAVYLLGELRATQCLPDVLETFSQSKEYIEQWFGDFITGNLWEPLYYIGNNQLPLLKEFVLTPGIDTYARTEVCSCITQIYHHHPERKQEVAEWFRDLFTSLAAARLNDNIVDSDFIALAICDAMELTDPSLLPEIRDLYRLGYVNKGICGSYEQIERDFTTPRVSFQKRELLNIFDRYHEIITTWASYTEKDEAEDGPTDQTTAGTAVQATDQTAGPADKNTGPFQTGPRVGRNDPCPCGSGKKYKHCCLRR